MFIGRESELMFLENKYKENRGQFIVLYGRRRVGKTETLHKFCEGKPHVFFSCRECQDKLQLKNFSEKMLSEGLPAAKYVKEFSDWDVAFRSILELPYGETKKLVIIDEFPYMCKGNSSIPSILQNLWDEILKDSNVMLILCGSSMSFIEREILSEKNPLYGRATGIYKMNEMDFYDAVKFFPDYSDKDKLYAYSILGGIPHYLKQFEPEKSVEDNIKEKILTKGSALYSEVEFLLKQELRETALYNSIIESIALGNTKLNDISNKSLIEDTAKTSVYLKNLIELGIVKREFSVNVGIKEKANSKKGLYKLTDNYFRFWYSFIFTHYSELELGDVDGVYKYVVKPELDKYTSVVFENVCQQFLQKMQIENKLPFRYDSIGRWWGKTTFKSDSDKLETKETEIDILAVSQKSCEYLVGECKFTNKSFKYADYLNTKAKLVSEQKKNKFYYYLFSKSGFENKLLDEKEKCENLHLITMEDVVNKL